MTYTPSAKGRPAPGSAGSVCSRGRWPLTSLSSMSRFAFGSTTWHWAARGPTKSAVSLSSAARAESFVNEALKKGADVLVTGDVDYHDADEARHGGLVVIDAGHFGTEKHVPHDLKEYLQEEAAKVGAPLEIWVAEETDVFWRIQDGPKEGC